ncbi:MAG: mandelate racemase/muconate lactonizing enzyme family protein [Betaproteobacteria bacterium]
MSRIAAVEAVIVNVSAKTNWTFVALTTDEGITGWGECSLNGWETLLSAQIARVASDVVGRPLTAPGTALRYLPHSPGGLIAHATRSALEQACTDARALTQGVPIHVLLGAAVRGSVPAYANINRGVPERSPQGFATAARRAIATGYAAVKLAPFDGVIAEDAAKTPIGQRIQEGIDRIFAVRDAIGPDVPLLVDCHWRFDEARAEAMIRDVRLASPYWIECPISEHPGQFAAIARLREVAHRQGIKLAGGEMITGVDDARAMCAAGLYDVLMPDIKYAGGYAGILAIAGVCAEHDVMVAPHNPTGPVAHLASIHACAVAPNVLWLEHQWGESPLFESLVGGTPAPLMDGALIVPAAAGLGAALDRSIAAKHPYRALPQGANLDERLG